MLITIRALDSTAGYWRRPAEPIYSCDMQQQSWYQTLAAFTGILIVHLALAADTAAPAAASAVVDPQLQIRARAIHERILTLDSHVDVVVPGAASEFGPKEIDRADLDKLRRGGIDAVAFAIAVGPGPRTPEGIKAARAEADAKLGVIRAFIKTNGSQVALALSAIDVRRLHKQGKIAVIESFLNARSLGKDLSGIDEFYKAGVRLFGFVHAGNNDFADSSRPIGEPQQEFHGLSPLGKKAVGKLNRLGVIIDVSQLSSEGLFQVLKISKAPVVASHSAVRALADNSRNLSDPELDAIKANGGVVQVTAFNLYLVRRPADYIDRVRAVRARYGLSPDFQDTPAGFIVGSDVLSAEQQRAFRNEFGALYPKATVKEFVDNIDYIVRRIGIDHVGIGTDFNHGAGIIGFEDESEAPNITAELLRRGYDESQIAKIWGGNFLRVFDQVGALSRNH